MNTTEEETPRDPFEPAQPLEGATLRDWRFKEYAVTMYERAEIVTKDESGERKKIILSSEYANFTVNPAAKIKAKKGRYDLLMIALPIPAA